MADFERIPLIKLELGMTVHMPKTLIDERIRWVEPIASRKIKIVEAMQTFPYGKRTLERWLKAYKTFGPKGLIAKSTRPKSNPKDTPIRIKQRVIELRKEEKVCALTLRYKLEKEGIYLHHRTIGKILKDEGLTRRYRIRKVTYKYLKAQLKPGELVEIDVKFVPRKLEEKRYYQFTAIDKASRWRYLEIFEDYGNGNSIQFLSNLIERAPFPITAVKTDNGSNFTNRYTGYLKSSDPEHPRLHEFDVACNRLSIIHYLIDPGKPAQNGSVERSHRTDQEHFYDRVFFRTVPELKLKLRLWNMTYNNREHIALQGMSPLEYLQQRMVL